MLLGVIHLDGAGRITSRQKRDIKSALSRRECENIHEYSTDCAYIVKTGTGALFGDIGFTRPSSDSLCGIVGEPLLTERDARQDYARIAADIESGSNRQLQSARGVFCGFYYSESRNDLTLFADKLAIRPLYFWRSDCLVVFATAMRMLEALPFLRLTRNKRALIETVAFGYPLAERTNYKEVELLKAGEILRFTRSASTSSEYWRWDRVTPRKLKKEEISEEAHKRFKDAITIRAKNDDEIVAYLSGGMDSRAIVATLRELDRSTLAFNFSANNSQDEILARQFAEKIGSKYYHETRTVETGGAFRLSLASRISELIDSSGNVKADRPRAVWSGDGGSVAVGSVYLDQSSVDLMRIGGVQAAMLHFRDINNLGLPMGFMSPDQRVIAADVLSNSLAEEIGRHECEDEAQSLFLFLMANDQRRHLYDFYEELDRHRLEYQLPFFDSNFLEFVFSIPLDYRLYHRFYTDWFQLFSPEVLAIPWQTYPGHVPCPLPAPREYSYQWDSIPIDYKSKIFSGISGLRLALSHVDLKPMSRHRLIAAVFMHMAGLKDYTYAIKAAHILACQDYDLTNG